jgi:hypothetical protein
MPSTQSDGIELFRGPLYKYKSLIGSEFERTVDILRGNRIYCPKPSQLNDELECKPDIVIGDFNDPAYKANVEAWVRRCVRQRPVAPTEQEIQQELAKLTPEKLMHMAGESAPEYHAAIDQQFRIVSFALSPANAHLWWRYADQFRGVCIQFHLTPWIPAYGVKYSDTVPILDLVDDEGFAALDMTALRKRSKWAQEGEARLILREPPLQGDPVLVDQMLTFDPQRIKAIAFGYGIDPTKRKAITDAIKGRGIPLYVAGGAPFKEIELRSIGQS